MPGCTYTPSFSLACMAHLNVWTNRSASPLEEEWYGALRICLMQLHFKNWANTSEITEAIVRNKVVWYAIARKYMGHAVMVWRAVMAGMGITYGHFECAPTNLKNISPEMGVQNQHPLSSKGCPAMPTGELVPLLVPLARPSTQHITWQGFQCPDPVHFTKNSFGQMPWSVWTLGVVRGEITVPCLTTSLEQVPYFLE